MKILPALLLMAGCAAAFPLTDTKGRQIDVEIIGMSDTGLHARHAGKEITIPLARLSEESRKAVAAEIQRIAAQKEAARPRGLSVRNTGVKSNNGKFRYFFHVRNHEPHEWRGTLKIRMVASNGFKQSTRDFKMLVPADGASASFFDAYTGLPDTHGEYGLVSFEVIAEGDDGEAMSVPPGTIAPSLID